MTDQDLEVFTTILELPDGDIYDWYTQKKPIPGELKSDILLKLMKYELQR